MKQWLTELPPSELFKDSVKFIACDEDGCWYGYKKEPERLATSWYTRRHLAIDCGSAFKMPELMGDQWKESCISIEDIDAWQVQNER